MACLGETQSNIAVGAMGRCSRSPTGVSTAASPMSQRSDVAARWADVSDAEESETEWEGSEEGSTMSPPKWMKNLWGTSAPAHGEPTALVAAEEVSQWEKEQRDLILATAAEQARDLRMNAYAPEFIPTLSMQCPLVGVCSVIHEANEEEQDDARLHTEEVAVNIFCAYNPEQTMHAEAPFTMWEEEAPRNRSSSQKQAAKKKKPFWRRHHSSQREEDVPEVKQGESPEKSSERCQTVTSSESDIRHQEEVCLPEEEHQRRMAIRQRGVDIGKQSKEYLWYVQHTQNCDSEEMAKLRDGPDPTDRSISKRSWKYQLHVWRDTLNWHYLQEAGKPEGASVVSTEEDDVTHGSEADDDLSTVTLHSEVADDASSSSWSVR